MVGYFSLKAHLEEGWCHRLIALTDVKFVLSSREHKNIRPSSISLLLMLWHSRRNTLYLLSVVWLRVCILSTKRLLLDMNFAELWHHQNSFSDFKVLCLRVQEKQAASSQNVVQMNSSSIPDIFALFSV